MAALVRLRAYTWPGNVRELKHVIERAALLCTGDEVTVEDLPAEIAGGAASIAPVMLVGEPQPAVPMDVPPTGIESAPGTLEDMERQQILDVLNRVRWNRTSAAEILGISARTLYRRIKRYKLDHD
jgi:two-component system response regulator HydG